MVTGWRISLPGWNASCAASGEVALLCSLFGGGEGIFVFHVCCYLLVSFILASFSLSSGIIRAPPAYRMVNAGLCDYQKKKKKKDKMN